MVFGRIFSREKKKPTQTKPKVVKKPRSVNKMVKKRANKAIKRSRTRTRTQKKPTKTPKTQNKHIIKTVKKSIKKTAKKPAKRPVRKSVARGVKKPAKRAVKKTAKKPAKKTIKKTSRMISKPKITKPLRPALKTGRRSRRKPVKFIKPVRSIKKPIKLIATGPSPVQIKPGPVKPVEFSRKEANMKEVGRVIHFFDKANVAVVKLSATLRQGDHIQIKGNTTNIKQRATSMQVNHAPISVARDGENIGLLVVGKARPGDRVFRFY